MPKGRGGEGLLEIAVLEAFGRVDEDLVVKRDDPGAASGQVPVLPVDLVNATGVTDTGVNACALAV